eukprot:Rmarinus@m.3548
MAASETFSSETACASRATSVLIAARVPHVMLTRTKAPLARSLVSSVRISRRARLKVTTLRTVCARLDTRAKMAARAMLVRSGRIKMRLVTLVVLCAPADPLPSTLAARPRPTVFACRVTMAPLVDLAQHARLGRTRTHCRPKKCVHRVLPTAPATPGVLTWRTARAYQATTEGMARAVKSVPRTFIRMCRARPAVPYVLTSPRLLPGALLSRTASASPATRVKTVASALRVLLVRIKIRWGRVRARRAPTAPRLRPAATASMTACATKGSTGTALLVRIVRAEPTRTPWATSLRYATPVPPSRRV